MTTRSNRNSHAGLRQLPAKAAKITRAGKWVWSRAWVVVDAVPPNRSPLRGFPVFGPNQEIFLEPAARSNSRTTRNACILKALPRMARKMWRKQNRKLGSNEQGLGDQPAAA